MRGRGGERELTVVVTSATHNAKGYFISVQSHSFAHIMQGSQHCAAEHVKVSKAMLLHHWFPELTSY